ncbi:MAG TPA: glucose 1-dehydrogenase [Acidimicrobiales bacterium]|nr:glucose 1-dehydrogenase [Acidimicrobiales bacterium]
MALNPPTSPDFPTLEGKVALVTGGSRGLGREMVLALARAGADVAITSRKLEACEGLAAEVEATTGRRTFAHGCHVGHWDEVGGLVDATYDALGKVDVLVNNAGMSPLYPDLVSVSEELFDKVVGVNLKGPFRLAALVGARMAEGDGGSIINISSVASARPTPNELPYGAAKAGLDALTVGFAQAYGPKVRVNSIQCGPFFTDISEAWDKEQVTAMFARYPLGRGGQPHEVVGAALYLASDASSFTTGTVLRVDGGQAVAH